jgi:hypothetical protein
MSAQEIRQVWEMHRQQGLSLNINCGCLRHIGKTQFLRELIQEWRGIYATHSLVIWTRDANMGREYIDLIDKRIVAHISGRAEIIPFSSTLMSRLRRTELDIFADVDIFADEIEDGEDIIELRQSTLHFIAGVYSSGPQRPRFHQF